VYITMATSEKVGFGSVKPPVKIDTKVDAQGD
jgi:hypothetical protein